MHGMIDIHNISVNPFESIIIFLSEYITRPWDLSHKPMDTSLRRPVVGQHEL